MGDDTVRERKNHMEWVEASGEGPESMPIRIYTNKREHAN